MSNEQLQFLAGFEEASSDYGAFFEALIRYNRCRTVVEIGVAYGTTTPYLCRGVAGSDRWGEMPGKRMVYGFDLWNPAGSQTGNPVQHGSLEWVQGRIDEVGIDNCTLFQMDTRSDEFKDMLARIAPIDFALIDADHSYEGCKNDFEVVYPRLSDNGIIALHDTFRVDGCRQFAHELRTIYYDGTYDVVDLPWGNRQYKAGVTLLFKRSFVAMDIPPVDKVGATMTPEEIVMRERRWICQEKQK